MRRAAPGPMSGAGGPSGIGAFGLVVAILASPLAGQRLDIRTYSNDDGVPQQSVLALHQDRRGYIWLGTYGGASRFDGRTFRNFNLSDGLRSDVVVDFAEDGGGRLWAATDGGGLCAFTEGAFRCLGREAGLPDVVVRALADDGTGGLWVATRSGLAHLPPGGDRLESATLGLPAEDCLAVAVDRRGTLWVGTTAGLTRRRRGRFVPVAPELLGERRVRVVLPTPSGLFLGTDAGPFLLRGDAVQPLLLPPPLTDARVTGAALDRGGGIWITTAAGAAHMDGSRTTVVTKGNGLATTPLASVLVDREGTVWIGTLDGVSKLVLGPFLSYTVSDGLTSGYVRALTFDAQGRLWIGSPVSGMVLFDHGRLRPIAEPGDPAALRALALATLPDGRILAGTERGLTLIAGERVVRTYLRAEGRPLGAVNALLRDGQGVWLGTDRGLVRWRAGRLSRVRSPALRQVAVSALATDVEGRLWAGLVTGGVAVFDGRTVRHLGAAQGLTDQTVRALARHPDGAMWVASNGQGAFRVDGDEIRHFSTANGLADDTLWQVLCDRRGRVWLYTSHGLDRYDGRHFHHFGRGDGLLGLEGSAGAALEAADGRLWFGNGRGLLGYVPQMEQENHVPPTMVVEEVRDAAHEPVHPGAHLAPGAASLTLDFAALSFRDPEMVRYRYRLLGLDDGWIGPISDRSLRFGGLPPGSYTFEVTGANDDGVYAEQPARFSFVVDPFYWQTWWFRVAAAVVLAAALAGAHRLRTRRLEADRRRLAAAVAERTAELERSNRRLAELATTDELTGLANRRRFAECLLSHLRTHARAKPPQYLSLLLIDIDHFKRVNDEHGHPVGDLLLAGLAERLRRQVRANDLVARHGGEEFAVILPTTDARGAGHVAEKLHAAVRGRSFSAGGRVLAVTVSIGVSTVRADGSAVESSAEILFQEADEALYRAKGQGRDRVVEAARPVRASA